MGRQIEVSYTVRCAAVFDLDDVKEDPRDMAEMLTDDEKKRAFVQEMVNAEDFEVVQTTIREVSPPVS